MKLQRNTLGPISTVKPVKLFLGRAGKSPVAQKCIPASMLDPRYQMLLLLGKIRRNLHPIAFGKTFAQIRLLPPADSEELIACVEGMGLVALIRIAIVQALLAVLPVV